MEYINKVTLILGAVCLVQAIFIYFLLAKRKALSEFYSIFMDDNAWNEKTITGFMSFGVMVFLSIIQVLAGLFHVKLDIATTIDTFYYLTFVSLGIDGGQRAVTAFTGNTKSEQTPVEEE
jgi:hypothetical protein